MARPGEHRGPPDAARDVRQRLVQVVAPLGGRRRLDAEAEEAQAGEGEDRLGRVQRDDQRQRAGGVAKNVAEHDPDVLDAPITLADDSTNGSALSRIVSARITRKYCGMNTTVIEIAAARMPPQRLDCRR